MCMHTQIQQKQQQNAGCFTIYVAMGKLSRITEWFRLEGFHPPSTRPGCPNPYPTWLLTLLEMGQPQLLQATCPSVSLPSQ